MSTIFVTGGAGFIGGNFIHYHLKAHPEDRVVCIDKLTYAGNLSTLAPVMDNPNFRFVTQAVWIRTGTRCTRATLWMRGVPEVMSLMD